MNMFDWFRFDELWLSFGLLASMILALFSLISSIKCKYKLALIEQQMKLTGERNRSEFMVMNRSLVGVGQQLTNLDKYIRSEKQVNPLVDLSTAPVTAYNKALTLAEGGAAVDEIVRELDISRAEANLIHTLQQGKEAGARPRRMAAVE